MKPLLVLATLTASFAVIGLAHSEPSEAAAKMEASLYERLGGIQKIAAAADNCIRMEGEDEMMRANQKLAAEFDRVPKPVLAFGLAAYLANLAGGPQKAVLDIPSFERALMLDMKTRDHAWTLRAKAFEKAGVGMKEFEELKALYEKKYAAAKPMTVAPETFKDPKSLYARLGGIVPICLVVDDFILLLATDPTIGANKQVVAALQSGRVSAAGLRYLVTEQIAAASGGPFKYSGRTMLDSHKGLMVTEAEWNAAAAILGKVLDKYKVPAKERNELFAIVGSTKGDIVGR